MAQAISVTFLLLCFKISFIAGCDNVLSSDSEWFTSPNHPGNYPNEANYCWLIKSTHPIVFSFAKFELESNSDWLTIYNGPTTNSDILLQISQNPPLSVVSTTNQTLITFTSDGIGSYSGFNITYKPSTCNYVLSSDSGEFTSPGYPSKYSDNTTCRWLINATQPIALFFKTNYLQQNVFVTIYDGPTESFPVLLKSSEFEPWAVVSTANQLLITFISDSPKSFKGFNARYEPSPCQHISAPDSGWFSLANHPLNSPNNTQYCWLITATNPIMLSYSNLSPRRNKLRAYDGQTNGKRLYFPTSKSNSAENFYISSANQMFVVLITYGSSESFSGFNATYKQCIVQSSDSGRLTTPNHPEDCSNGASCCWVINTIAPLEFSFNPFHTAENNDELRIYNGPTQTSTLLLESQGKNLLWSSKKSSASQILVTFTSKASDSFSELNLTYSTASCQNVYVSEQLNRLTSPNYPENYPENSNECWLINSEHPIMIYFSQFELEINYDWLRIYDGPLLSSPLLLEASSNYTIPSSIVSTAHQVLVTFSSDNKNSYPGFNAIYSSYYPGITERPIECNEFIHVNSSGYVLTSLNFPSSYPNIRCNWNFESDHGTKIKFSFTDFSTQPEDYVSIFYYKPKRYIPSFNLLSGINASEPLSCNYISKESFLHVYFNPFSDLSMNKLMSSAMGFRATVTTTRINECGGNFSDSAGVLLGYEADAQHLISSGCVWHIQVVPGSQVNLTLNTLLGPKSSPDSYSLKVYEGQDWETENTFFAKVTEFSSLSMPFSVVSKSNEIVVLLNDETEYDKCLPRDYTKLSLIYETITSST